MPSLKKTTKKQVKKFVSDANSGSKFLAENKYLLIALGVGIGGYLIYSKVSKGIDAIGSGVADAFEVPETDVFIVDVQVDEGNLTITEEKADVLAKTLLEAFNYSSFGVSGTDEDKVKAVFDQIKTGDDYKAVYNAFGRRPWMLDGTPTHWIDKKFFSDEKDLNHWLREELSSFFDADLYEQVQSTILSAGMIL